MTSADADPDAILLRLGPAGARLGQALAPVGRLLTPVLIALGLVVVPALLALPFALAALAALALANVLSLGHPMLAAVTGALAGLVAVALVPGLGARLLGYFRGLERLSNALPRVVRVQAGEVAILRRRIAPAPPDPLPTWRFAEAPGPGAFLVRGGREVIWNGARAGYEKWLRETDLAGL